MVKVFKISLLTLLTLIVLAISGLLLWRMIERQVVKEELELATDSAIDRLITVDINGAPQWIKIRGTDKSNPVLLFIHGGPQNPMMPWAHLYQPLWEKHFTVVQWDQRGVGKSRHHPDTSDRIAMGNSIQQYVDDTASVIKFIQSTTHKDKVFLMGHSWGSVVGLEVAKQKPELLHAYIGTGQLFDMEQTEATSFQHALEAAHGQNNQDAIRELELLKPYPASLYNATSDTERKKVFITARKWNTRLLSSGNQVTKQLLTAPFLSPDYTLGEAVTFLRDTQNADIVNTPLFRKLLSLKFDEQKSQVSVPVFFFEGTEDHFTESSVVRETFPQIQAPQKALIWFENSGHFPMIQEPEAFAKTLIEQVLPLAAKHEKALAN